MSEICVVHLVWAPLGLAPFSEFITSYRENQGGLEHQLVIVFNGFDTERGLDEYDALLDHVAYRSLVMPQPTFDLPAYFAAAKSFKYKYFCFLNSYSIILDADWLVKMYNHASREGVGLVGATGSYESRYSCFIRMARSARPPLSILRPRALLWQLSAEYHKQREALRFRCYFDPFPNYHIRTNAFMLSRDVMLKLKAGPMRVKLDAERFESGKQSMTRQIFAKNLDALVVGRDGRAYKKEEWFESRTFRSGEQSNLLISDNRTRQYSTADPDTRKLLSEFAWGPR